MKTNDSHLQPLYSALNEAFASQLKEHGFTTLECYFVLQDFLVQVGTMAGLTPQQQFNMNKPLTLKMLTVNGFDLSGLGDLTRGDEFHTKVQELIENHVKPEHH